MRIDTNSWHYRLNHSVYGSDVPTKLCPYFWATVLSILVLSWLDKLFDYIESLNITIPRYNIGFFRFLSKHKMIAVHSLYTGLAVYGGINWLVFGNTAGIFNLGVGVGLGIWTAISGRVYMKMSSRTTYKMTKTKQPSILKEYVKARHSLVCPSLEFVDMQKDDFNNQVKKIDELKSKQISQDIKNEDIDMKIFDDVSFALDNLSEKDRNFLKKKYEETKKKYYG